MPFRPRELMRAMALAVLLVAAILAVAVLQHIGTLIMRHVRVFLVAAAAVSAFAVAGCSTFGGKADPALTEALLKIASDPNCAHTDRLSVILGPVPTGSVFLERTCPARAAEAPAQP